MFLFLVFQCFLYEVDGYLYTMYWFEPLNWYIRSFLVFNITSETVDPFFLVLKNFNLRGKRGVFNKKFLRYLIIDSYLTFRLTVFFFFEYIDDLYPKDKEYVFINVFFIT